MLSDDLINIAALVIFIICISVYAIGLVKRTKEERVIRKLNEMIIPQMNTTVLSLLSYQRKLLVFPHGDKSTNDTRGDEEQCKPEQGEADAVLRWDVIH